MSAGKIVLADDGETRISDDQFLESLPPLTRLRFIEFEDDADDEVGKFVC